MDFCDFLCENLFVVHRVTDGGAAQNSRVDKIRPPTAAVTNSTSPSKPRQSVALDGSASRDMFGALPRAFEWDFGDGSAAQTTTTPTTQHAFGDVGHFVVTLCVRDSNGLSAKASVIQT